MDFNFIPRRERCDVRIYTPTTDVYDQGYQRWQKPRGSSMVQMFAIGAGGGGGGGQSSAGAASGAGGGACSAPARFTCPAILLPDELFIQVGSGGVGGIAGGDGGAGQDAYIFTSTFSSLKNVILYTSASFAGGGQAGDVGNVAGTAGSIPTIQSFNMLGVWFATVGINGGNGGNSAAGTSITAWGTIPFSPGAGGGGTSGAANFDGGAQTATALLDIQNQGYYSAAAGGICAGGTTGAINGSSFAPRLTPFFNAGGAGGGSNFGGVGGNGGNGGYGCGGGGGGGGTTGGRGGNGGSGIVILVAW